MGAAILKRAVMLHGHKTSVSLEEDFWACLKRIAVRERLSVSALIERIDHEREHSNLSSAVRLFVLRDFQARIDPALRFGKTSEGASSKASPR